jgi:hypothetical protein
LTNLFIELIERIQGELKDLDRVIDRSEKSWQKAQLSLSEQDVYLDSVALNLHSFYSGLERLFELIARHVDSSVPDGSTWHQDLLYQMSRDVPNVRPAVISQNSRQSLGEFRRFRHLVRNVYATNLVPDKITGLMSTLPVLWPDLKAELMAFCNFMQALEGNI